MEEELLGKCSPIRRQLLGANGDNSDPLENNGSQGGDVGQSVAGQHWFPSDFEKVGRLEASTLPKIFSCLAS